MRGLRVIGAVALVVLMVLLVPSTAWAVCGTVEQPCYTRVMIDAEQDARIDELRIAGITGLGVIVFTQLVMLIGGWGRRG